MQISMFLCMLCVSSYGDAFRFSIHACILRNFQILTPVLSGLALLRSAPETPPTHQF